MKVDKNARILDRDSVNASYSNIPIRLEIATRILAGFAGARDTYGCLHLAADVESALAVADALIDRHNKTCEKES